MMSIGQLNNNEESQDGGTRDMSRTFHNSKDLFKKCKLIIQQQMVQINELTTQNQQMTQKIEKQAESNRKERSKLQLQLRMSQQAVSVSKDQVGSLTTKKQELQRSLSSFQKEFQSLKLKNEQFQKACKQLTHEKEQLQEKVQLLQQTVNLLDKENSRLKSNFQTKQTEIHHQIQQIRQLNSLLKQKHQMDSWSKSPYAEYEHQFPTRRFSQNTLSRHSLNNKYHQSQQLCSPFAERMRQQNPFASVQLRQSKRVGNRSKKQQQKLQFQTLKSDARSKSCQKYRNLNINHNPTQSYGKYKYANSVNIPDRSQTLTANVSPYSNSKKYRNPEMQEELTNIKKEILAEYGRAQRRQGKIGQQRINETLNQIQHKLGRMIGVSQDSESQLQ